MHRQRARWALLILAACAASWSPAAAERQMPKGGFILERDADVAKTEPGTHKGGGDTIGYSFFAKHRRPHPSGQLARTQADWCRRHRHPHQLRAASQVSHHVLFRLPLDWVR
jgi:hypothetical protein